MGTKVFETFIEIHKLYSLINIYTRFDCELQSPSL